MLWHVESDDLHHEENRMRSNSESPESAPSGLAPASRASFEVCCVYRTNSFKALITNHKSFREEENWSFHWVCVGQDEEWKGVAKQIKGVLGSRIRVVVGRVLDYVCLLDFFGKRSEAKPLGHPHREAGASRITPTVILVEEEVCFGSGGDRLWWVRRMKRRAWVVIIASVGSAREDIPRVKNAHAVISSPFVAGDLCQAVENVRSGFRRSCWNWARKILISVIIVLTTLVSAYLRTRVQEWAKQDATESQTENVANEAEPAQQPPTGRQEENKAESRGPKTVRESPGPIERRQGGGRP